MICLRMFCFFAVRDSGLCYMFVGQSGLQCAQCEVTNVALFAVFSPFLSTRGDILALVALAFFCCALQVSMFISHGLRP